MDEIRLLLKDAPTAACHSSALVSRRLWAILDHDLVRASALAGRIEATGQFSILIADEPRQLLDRLARDEAAFDGFIVDADLPSQGGAGFCRQLGRLGIRLPVLITGEASDVESVVCALESGAYDVIGRSCGAAELTARLRCHRRSFDRSRHATFPIGRFRFKPAACLLAEPGGHARIHLTPIESRLLRRLLDEAGGAVDSVTLGRDVRTGARPFKPKALDDQLYRLRRKLRAIDGPCDVLRTETGGYRLRLPSGPDA